MRRKRSVRKKRLVRKIILASAIICVVVFAFSFVIGDHIGFANGNTTGYGAGYLEGHDNGYQLGYSNGNTFGYENGYGEGYSEGHDNGYQLGYSEGNAFGYENGYGKGYDNGYDNGYEIGENHGYDNGYSAGHSEGYATGYDNGFNIGSHGYNIWDPTYENMIDFITQDKTNENIYNENENYTCYNFTADVIRNAEAENIRCAFVYLKFSGGSAHAIVAFDTIDRGRIFIEPQSDDEMSVIVGSPYGDQPWGTILNMAVIW
jgi:hypothetical protein